MRTKEEVKEFANTMFMLGQIEMKANTEWTDDLAVCIKDYVIGLFNEGIPDDTTKLIGEDGTVYFELKEGEAE